MITNVLPRFFYDTVYIQYNISFRQKNSHQSTTRAQQLLWWRTIARPEMETNTM